MVKQSVYEYYITNLNLCASHIALKYIKHKSTTKISDCISVTYR